MKRKKTRSLGGGGKDPFKVYHDRFRGDTYDACFRCDGKCEKFKISTIMPGEKEHMVAHTGLSVKDFEDRYLDRINTPIGEVDVLKMKDGCPFLDADFHCTIVEAKPVMCDTYPIIFSLGKRNVNFEIDRHDCPLVHWPEYNRVVERFRREGIPAMRDIPVPIKWWRTVALYDEFDVDYERIEKKLRRAQGYQTYLLEEVLAFACNGYERKARKLGLRLFEQRLRSTLKKALERISIKNAGSPTSRLIRSYKINLMETVNEATGTIKRCRMDEQALTGKNPNRYLACITHVKYSLEAVSKKAESFRHRLREFQRAQGSQRIVIPSRRIGHISPNFLTRGFETPRGISAFDVLDWGTKDARDGYCLLASEFGPDELDGPMTVKTLLTEGLSISKAQGTNGTANKRAQRWVMVVVRDRANRLVGVADGSLMITESITAFYLAHIVTRKTLRSRGVGSWLSGTILQAASDHLAQFNSMSDPRSGSISKSIRSKGDARLMCEVVEVEFPNHLQDITLRRLYFHARLGRKAIWPLRYAQPDTDYTEPEFARDLWNSVPMFLCYRDLINKRYSVKMALEATNMLYDNFKMIDKGAESDREYLLNGIEHDGTVGFADLPKNEGELETFIDRTGTFAKLLLRFYPEHKYTRDRWEMLTYLLETE